MLNPTTLFADAFADHLQTGFRRTFGDAEPHYATLLANAAKAAVEALANSDALYHDAGHTALVAMVGQDILRGRVIAQAITPADWLHFMLAALTHDIGYIRGVCRGDQGNRFVIDAAGGTVEAPRGASDAFLTPWHVERSKIAVRERFGGVPWLDVARIERAIELTRFPVPEDDDHRETGTEAGLLRAADLIGQLGDPLYLRKLNALYYEFVETGVAAKLGYDSPADLVDRYPEFFWNKVEPFIPEALHYLDLTMSGKQWIANLYSHTFAVEHHRRRLGPQADARPDLS